MSLLTQKENKTYISVLSSDGTLRQTVDAGTPGAVLREYETSDKKKGSKHELVFNKLEGKIVGLSFYEGDYGKNLQVEIENAGDKAVLSLNVGGNFGEDVMKKFPNINLEEEVSFEPFSFVNDKEKQVKGISIKQRGEKIQNYYFDADKKKPINGMLEPQGNIEKYGREEWKIHFLMVRKFLVEEMQKLIENRFPKSIPIPVEYPEDNIKPEEIPF